MSESVSLEAFRELVREVRNMPPPISIHGRQIEVLSLLSTMNVSFESRPKGLFGFDYGIFGGSQVFYEDDDAMPPGVVEVRNEDGAKVRVFIRSGSTWYVVEGWDTDGRL